MLIAKTERAGRPEARRFSLLVIIVAASILGFYVYRMMSVGLVDSAIGRVRVISAAETQFAKEHAEHGYTCEFSQLPRDDEITRLLAKHQIDNGYAFEIVGCQAAPTRPNSTYNVTARPLRVGPPAFCSNPSGILMFDEGGSVEKCLAKRNPYQ